MTVNQNIKEGFNTRLDQPYYMAIGPPLYGSSTNILPEYCLNIRQLCNVYPSACRVPYTEY